MTDLIVGWTCVGLCAAALVVAVVVHVIVERRRAAR